MWEFQQIFLVVLEKNGKYLKNYLPDEIWNRFLKTYPKRKYNFHMGFPFAMGELFKDISREISHRLGFFI